MAYAIPTPPSPKFGRAVFASQSPYMPAQTSVTAGTLGDSFYYCIIIKLLTKIKNVDTINKGVGNV